MSKLERLQDRITAKQIECTYIVMELSLAEDDKAALHFIKMLNADEIDWGTLPDCMSNSDFIKMANLCGTDKTKHKAHMVNWIQKVVGTHIYDCPDDRL